MKKTVTTLVAALLVTCGFAQKLKEKDVPAVVKNALQQKYPAATKVKWEKEGNQYEAGFQDNKTETSVLLDAQGNITETETEIPVSQLPAGVLAYVQQHYPGKKVKEAAKITDAAGTVTYEVEIKDMDLIFSSNGGFIKEVKD